VEVLRQALDTTYAGRRVHLVFGAVQDKDVGQMLARLLPRMASCTLTPLDTPRSLQPSTYSEGARQSCADVQLAASPAEALEAAVARAAKQDIVLVAGSLYLVGAVKAYLQTAQVPART